MTEKERAVLQKAIRVWGKTPQILMVLEEMSELQKEILKNINRGKENVPDMALEVADVEIMLAQLKMIYDIEDAVNNGITEKLKIIEDRLRDK